MTVGYRTVLRLDGDADAVDTAERHVTAWLQSKASHVPEPEVAALVASDGVHELTTRLGLTVVGYAEATGRRHRRWHLEQTSGTGVWDVTVDACARPGARRLTQTIVVEAGHREAGVDSAVRAVTPPTIVSRILAAEPAWDGAVRLTSGPTLVGPANVRQLVAALIAPGRLGAVVIASSPSPDLDEAWQRIVAELTSQCTGVATTFVVASAAVPALSELLPPHFRVGAGIIRTFQPDVRLDVVEDGLRHRILGPATVARAMTEGHVSLAMRRGFGTSVRDAALGRTLPRELRNARSQLDALEDSAVQGQGAAQSRAIPEPADGGARRPGQGLVPGSVPGVVPGPVPGVAPGLGPGVVPGLGPDCLELPGGLEQATLLLKTISTRIDVPFDSVETAVAALTQLKAERDAAVGRLHTVREEHTQLTERLAEARSRLEELELDAAVEAERARTAEGEAIELRHRLALANPRASTDVEPNTPEWAEPTSVIELVARITPGAQQHKAFDRVVFTGDAAKAVEIDRRDAGGRYVAAFWDFVHVLYDYATIKAAGGCNGGVHAYLITDSISGHKCSPARHAAEESDTVVNTKKLSSMRNFRVPTTVSATGRTHMFAHFRPTWADQFAPRMHYYDDVDHTGKIYIGYIGRHLRNTKT